MGEIVGMIDMPGGIINTNSLEVGTTRIPNTNIGDTGFILNMRAKYTANYGLATISTANTSLSGSGTLGTVLTAASNGTYIKRVVIKGSVNTTTGMVRLFIGVPDGEGGFNNKLIKEVEIPAVTKSSVRQALSVEVDLNFYLASGYLLKASTEKAETFNVIAEGMDITYPA